MTSGAGMLPPGLREQIEEAIAGSTAAWEDMVADNLEHTGPDALPLAVKYLESRWAGAYRGANKGLFIGSNNYTWGRGVYVTGVEEPLSTAIYGRAGVVARFDPTGWRAFDARQPLNEGLYLRWLQAQVAYPDAVLTVHADHWLHKFRNLFREQFRIDVVLFSPDEIDSYQWYTRPDDTWMAVSDWAHDATLDSGYSTRFLDARLTILIEEEFRADKPPITRSPWLTISGFQPNAAALPARARKAYAGETIERVPS